MSVLALPQTSRELEPAWRLLAPASVRLSIQWPAWCCLVGGFKCAGWEHLHHGIGKHCAFGVLCFLQRSGCPMLLMPLSVTPGHSFPLFLFFFKLFSFLPFIDESLFWAKFVLCVWDTMTYRQFCSYRA